MLMAVMQASKVSLMCVHSVQLFCLESPNRGLCVTALFGLWRMHALNHRIQHVRQFPDSLAPCHISAWAKHG
jgi:hypothetical protein